MTDERPADAQQTPLTPPDADETATPTVSEALGTALGTAARKAGLDPTEHTTTGQLVWAGIGGWRGVVESVLPTLAFVLAYTLVPADAWTRLIVAVAVSIGIALVFSVVRFAMRQTPAAALGGLVGAVVAATIALLTGNAADTFLVGLITNAVYGLGILVSGLVGWSAIGLAAGFLMGDATAWRRSRRKRRAFFWLAIGWAGLFLLRLAVQFPVYLASHEDGQESSSVALLGTLKIAMGIPLFAVMIAVTWFVVRRIYHRPAAPGTAAPTGAAG